MMNKDFDRLSLLLAASGLDERTLHEALRAIDIMGPARAVDEIKHLRRTINNSGGVRTPRETQPYRSLDQLDVVVEQVLTLLQKEAGLSSIDITELLRDIHSPESKSASAFPEFKPKEGLRKWLRRVAKLVGPSQLLHYATRIRNHAVHNPASDWTLRAGKEEK